MDDIKQTLADFKFKLAGGDRNVFEEKLREQAPCIVTHMQSGLILFASKRVNDIFGYLYNELEGKLVEELMPESYRGRHAVNLDTYAKAPKYRNMGKQGMPLKGMKKDGSEFDIKIALVPFYEDGEAFVLATIMEL